MFSGNCLGIIINNKERTISIPHHKLHEILGKCEHTLKTNEITVKELQSLICSLTFIYKCVRPSRFFVNRLLNVLRSANASNIKVNEDIRKDISWFVKFLPVFNGSTTYNHGDIAFEHTPAIDACLHGVGGVWNENVYTTTLPRFIKDNEQSNITHLEMVNIIIALQLWAYFYYVKTRKYYSKLRIWP